MSDRVSFSRELQSLLLKTCAINSCMLWDGTIKYNIDISQLIKVMRAMRGAANESDFLT